MYESLYYRRIIKNLTKEGGMKKTIISYITNIGLLISAPIMAFSGLSIQFRYHMGNHGFIDSSTIVLELHYQVWSNLHKYASIIFSIFMISHFALHWLWYKAVLSKGMLSKHKEVVGLTIIFILVAFTGLIPWIIHITQGDEFLRKAFMEVHDKLALILFIYLTLHITKRLKWFMSIFYKLKRSN